MTDPDPWTIRIHHVGGGGEAGPLGVLSQLGNVQWYVYEAAPEAAESSAKMYPEYHMVEKAIGWADVPATFHVTAVDSASSLLKSDPNAKDYAWLVADYRLSVWGPHTRVAKEVSMNVRSIDSLVRNGEVPGVDFLSVDAQGAELDILDGAGNELRNNVMGLIIEAEFAPLYEGQPLFCDTMARLRRDGFRLCDILNLQHFFTYPYSLEILEAGFLTVAEVLYLKESRWVASDTVRSLKLAAISAALGRLDYALRILAALEDRGVSIVQLAREHSVKYLGFLASLWGAAKIVQKASPPVIEVNGGLGPQPPLPWLDYANQPDPISDVLANYGFAVQSSQHREKVRVYRLNRAARGGTA
jgi:FkbM family methyltransferase